MRGLMMDMPMLISRLICHADREHGDTEIVSRTVEGPIHRYTFHDAHHRSRQLANALLTQGVRFGDRIATLAWNTYRHFELFYAISGIGAICHTVNPRLFAEQLLYIFNDAEDRYIFLDLTFVEIVQRIAPQLPHVRGFVILTDRAHMPQTSLPNALCYEELVGAASDQFEWPQFDEHTASSLCYTSGTTGNPKGVLYSHRSNILHAYAMALPDTYCLSATDIMLPAVPLFHANAWGIPYACALVGTKMVLPGSQLDGASLHELFEREGATVTAGVPTVWFGLLGYMKQHGLRFSTLNRALIGGSACPAAMIQTFEEEYGVRVLHAWGMTELSPLGTLTAFKAKHTQQSAAERRALQSKQGRVIFGVEMKIVDDAGNELPRDGRTFGNLMVRGPWICQHYFKAEHVQILQDGWFGTGDVATIDPDGYMQITDRAKDVIKSGGEWISSIELENCAVGHPDVAEAAVVGVPHAKWGERPLLLLVRKPGASPSREDVLQYLAPRIAKWWLPDDVVFVDALPHTATGKLLKTKLREDFRDHLLKQTDRPATQPR
ncbi:MAG TPA: 3-(methylthio)propionyl-CoA ligase [Steroidobacteraceae bacterium]|jgi:acyl-CoA synthetase (AMP-forming)/AMP-acid ligase II|nr:3-(methylthio)propionyl-CoA ligase [Steroidobacteraceae bacterium]